MNLTLKYDTKGIDWDKLVKIYAASDFEDHDAKTLKATFEAADAVCFGFDGNSLIGGAWAKDGQVHDLCVLRAFQGFDPARIMYDYLAKQAGLTNPPIIANTDAKRKFCKEAELEYKL